MRYVITEKSKGVFLRVIDKYAIFASENIGIMDAIGFPSKELAQEFIDVYLDREKYQFEILEIDAHSVLVPLEKIIAAGYAEATYGSLEFLPSPSRYLN